MYQDFFNGITNLISDWCNNIDFLVKPLPIPNISLSPLYIFSAAGISLFITIHAVKLFIVP